MNLDLPRRRCESSQERLVLRLGEGTPRRGQVRLGELEDKKWDLLVYLGEAVGRQGEPLRLSKGRLCLGELAIV